MRRDWELIRVILKEIEQRSQRGRISVSRHLGALAPEVVNYHLWLLIDAGLIKGTCYGKPFVFYRCYGKALTWEGQGLLDRIRTDEAWNRVKKRLNEKGLELSYEAIVAAGRAVITGADIG